MVEMDKNLLPIDFEGLKERWNLPNLLKDQIIGLTDEENLGIYIKLDRKRQTYYDIEDFINKLVINSKAGIKNLKAIKPLFEERPDIVDSIIKMLEKDSITAKNLKVLLKKYPDVLNHFLWFEKNQECEGGLKRYLTRCKAIDINSEIKKHEEGLKRFNFLTEKLRDFIRKNPLLIVERPKYERLSTNEEMEICNLSALSSIKAFFALEDREIRENECYIWFGFFESTNGDGKCDILLTDLEPTKNSINNFEILSGSAYIFYSQALFYVNKLRNIVDKIDINEDILKFLINNMQPKEKSRILSKEDLQIIKRITGHIHRCIISQAYYFREKSFFLSKELYFFTDQLVRFESSNGFKEFKAILRGTTLAVKDGKLFKIGRCPFRKVIKALHDQYYIPNMDNKKLAEKIWNELKGNIIKYRQVIREVGVWNDEYAVITLNKRKDSMSEYTTWKKRVFHERISELTRDKINEKTEALSQNLST